VYRRNLRILGPVILIVLGAIRTRAQNNPSPATPPPSAAQQATENSSPSTEASTPRPPEPAPAKKVWTNEELGGAHAQPGTSTSQPARNANTNPHPKIASGPRARGDAQWYHDQIAKLQAKLPPLDEQIAKLQAAIDGAPTGDAKTSTRPTGVRAGDWRTQLADAHKQRDDIADKIAALQDEARHFGIPPDMIP
jgi:hypothetical protein